MSFLDSIEPTGNPVQDHSMRVFQLALEAGDATRKFFKENGEELSTTAWFGVVMECQNLYMQLTDRAIFGHIPETKRHVLMSGFDALCIDTTITTICKGWGDERIAGIQKECMENYKKSYLDYGVCKKLFPEKGEGPGGTMIWEFSKTVAGLVGHDFNAVYIMFFTRLVDFQRLKLNEFVEGATKL